MSKLKWRDSEDVYQPISRHLQDFLNEKEASFELNIGCSYATLSNKPMNIFIVEEAEDKLKKHLTIDPNNETGGVLVGQAYFCPETKSHYTEILGSIGAPYTVGNRVHFKFTPECWQEIFKIQKQTFPNTTIVGWYHSHPGHGIFLSGTDLNTQRLSFKQVWQIAIVYDPIRHQIGYFYGADGKILEDQYIIYFKEKSSGVPKNKEPQLSIIPQTTKIEELDDSNMEMSIQQKARIQDQFVSRKEQQAISPDMEEEVLSEEDIHKYFREFLRFILTFLGRITR